MHYVSFDATKASVYVRGRSLAKCDTTPRVKLCACSLRRRVGMDACVCILVYILLRAIIQIAGMFEHLDRVRFNNTAVEATVGYRPERMSHVTRAPKPSFLGPCHRSQTPPPLCDTLFLSALMCRDFPRLWRECGARQCRSLSQVTGPAVAVTGAFVSVTCHTPRR